MKSVVVEEGAVDMEFYPVEVFLDAPDVGVDAPGGVELVLLRLELLQFASYDLLVVVGPVFEVEEEDWAEAGDEAAPAEDHHRHVQDRLLHATRQVSIHYHCQQQQGQRRQHYRYVPQHCDTPEEGFVLPG